MRTLNQMLYDNYVTSGGSDPCFSNGMNGHCGFECSVFGSKPECFDGMTAEQIEEWKKGNED